jgi:uncharacterized protein
LSDETSQQQKAAKLQAPDTPTTAVPPPPRPAAPERPRVRPRSLQLALFLTAMIWYLCARMLAENASIGLAQRFDPGDFQPLMSALFLLFLVICGFALLRAIEQRKAPLRLVLGFPKRATSRTEWGLAIASMVPMVLSRSLNVHLWTAPRAFELLGIGLATLAVATLAHTLAAFGYGFQRLIEAAGPVRATLILAALATLKTGLTPSFYETPNGTRLLITMLGATLLCLCWFRTHGLWIAWGLHFAWAAATGVLFGLPLGGDSSFASVVDARAAGPLWITGGNYGPMAAFFSVPLLIAAIPILVRVTSDWAWKYTHPPIIPAGYDVTIAPPAAHVAMEQAAVSQPVNPASLVQILPAAPSAPPVGGTTE